MCDKDKWGPGIERIRELISTVPSYTKDDIGYVVGQMMDEVDRMETDLTPQPMEEMEELYVCPDCGCPDIEGTTYIHLNTERIVGSEPPRDTYWCPCCEEETKQLCLVGKETGKCCFSGCDNVVKPNFKWQEETEDGQDSTSG
jgi:hypothetical protein